MKKFIPLQPSILTIPFITTSVLDAWKEVKNPLFIIMANTSFNNNWRSSKYIMGKYFQTIINQLKTREFLKPVKKQFFEVAEISF